MKLMLLAVAEKSLFEMLVALAVIVGSIVLSIFKSGRERGGDDITLERGESKPLKRVVKRSEFPTAEPLPDPLTRDPPRTATSSAGPSTPALPRDRASMPFPPVVAAGPLPMARPRSVQAAPTRRQESRQPAQSDRPALPLQRKSAEATRDASSRATTRRDGEHRSAARVSDDVSKVAAHHLDVRIHDRTEMESLGTSPSMPADVRRMMRRSLRAAVIMSEIIGPPVGLRSIEDRF